MQGEHGRHQALGHNRPVIFHKASNSKTAAAAWSSTLVSVMAAGAARGTVDNRACATAR